MAAAQYWRVVINRGWARETAADVYISELRLVVTPGSAPLSAANISSVSLNFTPVSGTAANLYDDSHSTSLQIGSADIPGASITFTLNAAQDVKELRINSVVSNSGTTQFQVPLSWDLQSSTDGVNFTSVQTATDIGFFMNNRGYSDVRNYRALIGAKNSWMLILLSSTATKKAIAELELIKGGTDLVQAGPTQVYATSEDSAAEGVDKLKDADVLTVWRSAVTDTDAIYVLTNETDGNQIESYSITAENVASPVVADGWILLFTPDGNDWQVVDARYGETFTQGEKKTFTVGATGFTPLLSQIDASSTVSNGGYDIATPRGSHLVGGALLQQAKWYFEIHMDRTAGLVDMDVGLAHLSYSHVAPGFALNKFVAYRDTGSIYSYGTLSSSGHTAYTSDTSVVIGVAYDAASGFVWFSRNGVWINGGNPGTGVAPIFTVPAGAIKLLVPFAAHFNDPATGPDNIKLRDGTANAPLQYALPTGYKPISQAAAINVSVDLVSTANATDLLVASKDVSATLTSTASASEVLARFIEATGVATSQAAASDVFSGAGSELQAAATSSLSATDQFLVTRELLASIPDSLATAQDTYAVSAELIAVLESSAVARTGVLLSGVPYDAWVMNTETSAVSRYQNYNFNSMARIGDRYYAASEDGVVELAGNKDGAANIKPSIYLGRFDFDSGLLKRVKRAYLHGRSDGKLVLKVVRDDQTVDTYTAAGIMGDTPSVQGVVLGRGAKAHYWQFELETEAGEDFFLSKVEVVPILLTRRVR